MFSKIKIFGDVKNIHQEGGLKATKISSKDYW